jgi:CBS domain-containing protein
MQTVTHGCRFHNMNNLSNIPVKDIGQTDDLIMVQGDRTAGQALSLMKKHRIRHLLVMDDEAIIGILSPRDLLRVLKRSSRFKDFSDLVADDLEEHFTAKNLMSWPVKTVNLDLTLQKAAEQMLEEKLSALVLTHPDGRLAGILTQHDLLKALVAILKTVDGVKLSIGSILTKIGEELSSSGI